MEEKMAVPFRTAFCIEDKYKSMGKHTFFKFAHCLISLKFDWNDEKMLRIRLKAERRHSKRHTPKLKLKDELNRYGIGINVKLTADGKIIGSPTAVRRRCFGDLISFTANIAADQLLKRKNSKMQVLLTLTAFEKHTPTKRRLA